MSLKHFIHSNTATGPISNQRLNNSSSDQETKSDVEDRNTGDTNANPQRDIQKHTDKKNNTKLKDYYNAHQ